MSVIPLEDRINPYDYSRPVSIPGVFAGRVDELHLITEEIKKLGQQSYSSQSIALAGERRVGKTSILFRTQQICDENGIVNVLITLTESVVIDPWNFWHVVFDSLASKLSEMGIGIEYQNNVPIGFLKEKKLDSSVTFEYPNHYSNQRLMGVPLTSNVLIKDFNAFLNVISEKKFKGLVILLDEAHLLVDLNEIQQQLRDCVTSRGDLKIIMAGEPSIGRVFSDENNRLFHQGRVIKVENFTGIDEVADCAIQPLRDTEQVLMSPMTIDYLSKLSQGKPNQIRFICHAIYSRFARGDQDDLNINIDILNDVLEVISSGYTEYNISSVVEKINQIKTIDLEILYRITRYPNWNLSQIMSLDHSFRSDGVSPLADQRYLERLKTKQQEFIKNGLLIDDEDRCLLAGDEFTYLYVRFIYEIRKYGNLSEGLVLGKGPSTPFVEKIEKLCNALSFQIRRKPRFNIFTVYKQNIDPNQMRNQVRKRYEVLQGLLDGKSHGEMGLSEDEVNQVVSECMRICEFVSESGPHHCVTILARNARDVNEIIHIELYYDPIKVDPVKIIFQIPQQITDYIKKQGEAAEVWIEYIDDFQVLNLTCFNDLLDILGLPSMNELLETSTPVTKWRFNSVHHIIEERDKPEKPEEYNDVPQVQTNWLQRYNSGAENEAIDILTDNIEKCSNGKYNQALATFYNDRGYIKSTSRVNDIEGAINDLNRAIAYHFFNLELSLLNLACIYIDQKDYPQAKELINDALFLATSRDSIETGYLKLRMKPCAFSKIVKIEQQPANVVEACYINLAYIHCQEDEPGKALEVIEEGSALYPDSPFLKYAKARILLSLNKAPEANSLIEDLINVRMHNPIIEKEIDSYAKRFLKNKKKSNKRQLR